MMIFGISAMVGELFINLIFGNINMFDWMLFCIWAVVAVCGAIKEART